MNHKALLKPLATSAVALLLMLAVGCTTKTPSDMGMSSPDMVWTAFRQQYCVTQDTTAIKVTASLYFTRVAPRKRTNRTLMTLWGDTNGTMRLDLAASIGTSLAHIREDDSGLLVFYPSDKEAYTHADPVLGVTRLGMPFPFSVAELGRVLTGQFSDLVPAQYKSVEQRSTPDGGFRFMMTDPVVSSISLDREGRPVRITGPRAHPSDHAPRWVLEIDRFDTVSPDSAPLPGRITLTLNTGEKGVLHIKSREFILTAWPAKSLALPLPEGIVPIRLDAGNHDQQTGDIPVTHEDR
ncbi:hypothetical protein GO013_13800 [Pseudodesulfovibrio sp. JC047]|uniref:hypothetical protein n=1 Tax=Pseudodesulfovibrio sp. JC047 TaxID=2683199 RepID=UPI0013D2E304|nr:hypothetical protein [Pseudodesulfovibrio sp. JC047]NDV20485.1 hypothetical protein [Pseudodesulfovibrio sp. JC047]